VTSVCYISVKLIRFDLVIIIYNFKIVYSPSVDIKRYGIGHIIYINMIATFFYFYII